MRPEHRKVQRVQIQVSTHLSLATFLPTAQSLSLSESSVCHL